MEGFWIRSYLEVCIGLQKKFFGVLISLPVFARKGQWLRRTGISNLWPSLWVWHVCNDYAGLCTFADVLNNQDLHRCLSVSHRRKQRSEFHKEVTKRFCKPSSVPSINPFRGWIHKKMNNFSCSSLASLISRVRATHQLPGYALRQGPSPVSMYQHWLSPYIPDGPGQSVAHGIEMYFHSRWRLQP
jgi:hypothetical protein